MSSIEVKKKNRIRFLQKLYELTGGSRATGIDMDGIGKELKFDFETNYDVRTYLANETLILIEGRFVKFTHNGIKAVEANNPHLFEEQNRNRTLFLKRVFEKAKGDVTAQIDSFAVGSELGFDHDTMWDTAEYLEGEGFIRFISIKKHINITHRGIKKVEAS